MKLLEKIIVSSLLMTHMVYPCAVTIVNDLLDPIIATTNDDSNCIFVLLPGDEKEFGDHHVKAKFTLLLKDEAGNYIQYLAVRQHACSGGKEIRLKATDLTAKKLNENIFIFGKPGTIDLRKMELCD